jgi:hypothetical protein
MLGKHSICPEIFLAQKIFLNEHALEFAAKVFMPVVINSFSLPVLFLAGHHQWAC